MIVVWKNMLNSKVALQYSHGMVLVQSVFTNLEASEVGFFSDVLKGILRIIYAVKILFSFL